MFALGATSDRRVVQMAFRLSFLRFPKLCRNNNYKRSSKRFVERFVIDMYCFDHNNAASSRVRRVAIRNVFVNRKQRAIFKRKRIQIKNSTVETAEGSLERNRPE